MERHSLQLLEFDRIAADVASRAVGEGARLALAARMPSTDPDERTTEFGRLSEAIRRVTEPGEWAAVGPGLMAELLRRAAREPLDGVALVEILGWTDAAAAVRESWNEARVRERFPHLADVADAAVPPEALRQRLARSLDPDGTLRDGASSELKKAREALRTGERRLEQQLERWSRGFGGESYVTRHGDRFVVMVPAAGFPRRRGIVHDVSGTGHSLLVEPLEACESNNELLEHRAKVTEEERRVYRELSQEVLEATDTLAAMGEALDRLDGLRARALWAVEHDAVALTPGGERLRLVRARHPLLAMAHRRGDGGLPVPLDLDLGAHERFLLVSGPNMGGKTVLLKTVGLAVVLAHAGFAVPAGEGSEIPEIDTVLVDLGDDQSVDQGLSTFAAHLKVLGQMAAAAGPRTLVLCDELGAGTDPEEGGPLGQAMIEAFAATGTWGVATTHLGSLKRLGSEIAGVMSGSLEFDEATLTSRYRFLPGIPGASHALSVAERLGFPKALVARARELTTDETRAIEKLTSSLAAAHLAAVDERANLEAARRATEADAAVHREAADRVQSEWAERRKALRREGEEWLSRTRGLWQTLDRESRKRELRRDELRPLNEEVRSLEGELDAMSAPANEANHAPPIPAEGLLPGVKVRVVDLGVDAEVLAVPEPDGRIQLRRGPWTIQSHVSKLRAVEAPAKPGSTRHAASPQGAWSVPDAAPALDLDLRGMEVDDALKELDRGLDQAVVSGLHELRIVHGVGRGVLRAAVERHLRGHPQVAEQRLGQIGEGGRGVTLARLR